MSVSKVIGGAYREGESSMQGYKIAASTAFRDGCQSADPVMLEPIMMVEIIYAQRIYGRCHRRHQLATR